jgi:ribosomal protein S18 acetylase RimI-like enzyme
MARLIREACKEDADYVISLMRELVESDEEGTNTNLSVNDIHHFLEMPGNVVLLVKNDDQVAGLLSYTVSFDLWHAADCCMIRELIIHAGYRQQGLGGLLLEEVFRRAEKESWKEVSVSTMPDNSAALALYRKHGMTDEAVLLERHF